MKTTLRRLVGALVVGTAAFASQTASALPFTNMVVFGDSLSDTGNIFLATGGAIPTAPYFNGRFSNGPVWVDTLATGLGLPAGAVASLAGGNNYAFGGARTGTSASPPGVLAQIGGLWAPSHPSADPNALYVVVGGGNDMRDARSAFQTNSAADQAGRQAAAAAAANNLLNGLGFLASVGAKNILLANLPDLGATPEAVALGLVDASSDASARFNAQIAALEIVAETALGLDVRLLDLAGIALAIRDDALNNGGAKFGITNVFTPCGSFQGSIGISCDVSAFSDALHPSARAHAIFGLAALQAVPEPGSVWLVLLAAFALVARVRRHA